MVNLYSVARHIAIRSGNIVLNRIDCSRGGKKMRNQMSLAELQKEYAQLLGLTDEAAISLPPAAYALNEGFQLEISRIFESEWVAVGRVEEVAEPGDYFTTELAGEPIIVVRGDDLKVRALSNVCRHKWTEVASGAGNARAFICPYHAWTYARDGQLVGAQFMDRTEGFRVEDCRLPALPCEIWGGFIFVNLAKDVAPVSERLSTLTTVLDNYHMQEMKKFTGDDEIWETNWKLLVENFTEGYHTFHTHRDSLQNVTPAALTHWGFDEPAFSAFYSPLAADEPVREPCHPSLTEVERRTVLMVCLYPSLVIALSPERVFYMCLLPVSSGSVRTRWGVASYGEDFESHSLNEIAQFYKDVNEEDKIRLESIQRGVGARYARQGRLSWLEKTTAHFGRYLARKLAG